MNETAHPPRQIILHRVSRTLELVYSDLGAVRLPAAFLRAHSPSASNRETPVTMEAAAKTGILSVEPVGHYAVRLLFSDGHRSGIYSWDTLRSLVSRYQQYREETS